MNRPEFLNAGTVYALQGPKPKGQIGVDRIFDQYGHIHALQRIGNFLYGERVCSRARTYPKDIDACGEGFFNVLGVGDFCRNGEAGFRFGFA